MRELRAPVQHADLFALHTVLGRGALTMLWLLAIDRGLKPYFAGTFDIAKRDDLFTSVEFSGAVDEVSPSFVNASPSRQTHSHAVSRDPAFVPNWA